MLYVAYQKSIRTVILLQANTHALAAKVWKGTAEVPSFPLMLCPVGKVRFLVATAQRRVSSPRFSICGRSRLLGWGGATLPIETCIYMIIL